jgi:hypothetical protein
MASASVKIEQLHDPLWRLNNLYQVINKDGKRVQFVMNDAQRHFVEGMHSRNIILKARQIGFTTLCCLLYLDDCLFNPDIRAAVIAHKLDDAKVIFRDKVKFPYETLPDALRARIAVEQDSADMLTFNNNSSIRVSTSTRSGTVNWLHVSEYGKICAQFPDKAREIRTGAFPSAEKGIITIESTAEGQEGDFYEKSITAEQNVGKELSRLDYKFFFYPWWRVPEYSLSQFVIPESPEDSTYFTRIESEIGQELTDEQRNWWLAQENDLAGDMKREYPATPKEAFEQAIEGAYFADQIAAAVKHERIGNFPVDPMYPVNTFWDLGRNDFNVIWLGQDIQGMTRFVQYYENVGEYIGHYINWLQDFKAEHNIQYGKHYLPHDGDRQSLWLEGGTMEVMSKLNFHPEIVQRTNNKIESINTARRKFQVCEFDERGCKRGLKHLREYRKEWNDRLGVWKNTPMHNDASHAADGFMTFSESNHIALPARPSRKRSRYRSGDDGDSGGSWMSA